MNVAVASKGTGINWPVLRYADVLLLLAEAENEINHAPTSQAKEMLKQVRQRAFINAENQAEKVDNYVNSLATYDDFKQAIIKERAWEFGGENIRKFDLIRWNYYSNAIADAIEWMRDVAINYQQLRVNGTELIYDKNLPIEDMGIAPRLYYNYTNGEVVFENDYFTYRDKSVSPYNTAESLKDDDIKTAGATFDGLKYISFVEKLINVDSNDPETGQPYGKDENGDDIKKGVVDERVVYSWFGLTDGVLVNGMEDLTPIRNKVTPYVFPIPTDRVMSSNGVLSNDGYAIRNK